MIKVYYIRLEGGGDVDEKFVDEETWNWIISDDRGQAPGEENESSWVDGTVPQAVLTAMKEDWPSFSGEVWLTSGSWENDRALQCPAMIPIDFDALDRGALRESLAALGYEYTGQAFDGCIY